VENENIKSPDYSINHLDEVNAVVVNGNGRGESQQIEIVTDATRMQSSRWNRVEKVLTAGNESSTSGLQNAGRTELGNHRTKEDLNVTFVNT
jgi:hypothetical protein